MTNYLKGWGIVPTIVGSFICLMPGEGRACDMPKGVDECKQALRGATQENNEKILDVRFDDFKGISCHQAVDKVVSDPTARIQAQAVLGLLPNEGQAILEDDGGTSGDNLGKVKSEAGYSFPPVVETLGPFMSLCAREEVVEILDIGPGMGPDTLIAAALGKKVTTIDVHVKQIKALKQEVARVTNDFKKSADVVYKKGNLADPKMVIPQDWQARFPLVNANKVFHFLDHEETKAMAKNIALSTKSGGYATITVLSPTQGSPEWEFFNNRVASKSLVPGLIFYDIISQINQGIPIRRSLSIVSDDERCRQTPQLVKPSQKIEFLTKGNQYLVLRQGRHYHTLETFMPYVDEWFSLIDHTLIKNDPTMWYLSVILKRK